MITRIFLLILLLAVNNGCAGRETLRAWWLDAAFETECPSVESDSVLWQDKCIILLDDQSLATLPGYDQVDMASVGAMMQTSFKGGGDASVTYYAVGVFRGDDGRVGRALVVSNDSAHKSVSRIFFVHGEAGFSALIKTRNSLMWTFCLYCADYELIENS